MDEEQMEFNRLMSQFTNTEYWYQIKTRIIEMLEQDLEVLKACEVKHLKSLQGTIQRTEMILSLVEDSAQMWRESEDQT